MAAAMAVFAGLAFTNVAHAETVMILDSTGLTSAFATGGDFKLGANVTLAGSYAPAADLSIDLNGFTLNTSSKTMVVKHTVTISDGAGGGKITGSSQFKIQVGSSTSSGKLILNGGAIEPTSQYGVRIIDGEFEMNGGSITGGEFLVYNQGKFVLNNGTITSSAKNDYAAVRNNGGSSFEMNGGKIHVTGKDGICVNFSFNTSTGVGSTGVINDGEIIADGEGGGGISLFKNADLTINGGKIIGDDSAIVGNGSGPEDGARDGSAAKITITDGVIDSPSGFAIYIPQREGVTAISGGTIRGAKTALEIRAGTLNVTGGEFISLSDTYSTNSNNSGTTTVGAAIAVAQHKTHQPIEVNVCAGTFRALVPFSERNPEENDADDISKVTINIQKPCGELMFESTGDKSVFVENALGGFIHGGIYTSSVADFLAEGYGQKQLANGAFEVLQYHNVLAMAAENGSLTVSGSRVMTGDIVEITVAPAEGYRLASLAAVAGQGGNIQISNNAFVMPDDDVEVSAIFEPIPEPEPEPGPQPEPTDEEPESPNTLDDLQTNVGIMAASAGGIVVALLIKPRKKKSYLL